jgi:hypothetical protein
MKMLSLFLAALLALQLSGCATKSKDSAKADDNDEYILVDSGLGSRIPRRIRIDQLSRATLQGAQPTTKITGEEIREMLAHPFPVTRGMGGNP